jgi:hypothetical protein
VPKPPLPKRSRINLALDLFAKVVRWTIVLLIAAGVVWWWNLPKSPEQQATAAVNSEPPEPAMSFDDANRELSQCLMPEAQYGRYSSFDGGKSAEQLLEKKCAKQYLAFMRACNGSIGGEDQEKKCVVIAAIAAQAAIKQWGK